MNELVPPLATGALAMVVAVAITPLVRRVAFAAGLVVEVRKDRWHQTPTPLLGGVSIFVGVVVAYYMGTYLLPIETLVQASRPLGLIPVSTMDGFMAATVLMFLTGLVDDVRELRPSTKAVIQLVAAAGMIASGVMLRLTGVFLVDVGLSLFWFVAITNAINLLDNMDGAAGGVAAIAAGYLGILALIDSRVVLAMMSLALAGALVGFLVYNKPPASIFMGDSGSLFVGMSLAGLALAGSQGSSRGILAVIAIPLLTLAVPILDTSLVSVTRILRGQSPFEGGRDHTTHRLVAMGLTEWGAVKLLWGLAAAGGAIGLLFRGADRSFALLLGGLLTVALAVFGAALVGVGREEVDEREADRLLERRRSAAEAGGEDPEAVEVQVNPVATQLLEWHRQLPLTVLILDVALVLLAYYAAYVIRWDGDRLTQELVYFQASVATVVAAKMAGFWLGGLHQIDWRFFGFDDAMAVVKSSALGTLMAVGALLLTQRSGLGRGVMLFDFLVLTAMLGASRGLLRALERRKFALKGEGKPAVVVSAGYDAGFIIDELIRFPGYGLLPVGVAEPGGRRRQREFHGRPWFGGHDAVQRACAELGVETVVVLEREVEHGPGEAGQRGVYAEYGIPSGVSVQSIRLLPGRSQNEPAPRD
jgi:UDP-GlcNAc:undecaprenyl-phosphate GlcNAc-1-phosphate transferase